MTKMAIAEIINEIDTYLSRLRQARKLLLDRMTEAPYKNAPRREGKVTVGQADPESSRRRRAVKNKSRSNGHVAHRKGEKEWRDPANQDSSHVRHHNSHLERPAVADLGRTMPLSVVIKRLPSKGPNTSIRSVRHRTPKSNADTKPDAAKPAIALAGLAGAKIVVVPAEQVRRERERVAQPEVRRPRVPTPGLTGRLAFEALFK
jgi:hypothetical protein